MKCICDTNQTKCPVHGSAHFAESQGVRDRAKVGKDAGRLSYKKVTSPSLANEIIRKRAEAALEHELQHGPIRVYIMNGKKPL